MTNPAVQGEYWFRATVRWAVMVEGRGLREWEEAVYLFRSEDDDSAFQRALAIGEGGQSGGEEGIQRPRWVETRLAEVVTLDCLGSELEDELEVHWMRRAAKEKIPFEHKFEPANKTPLPSSSF
jgi:hypothetical protein